MLNHNQHKAVTAPCHGVLQIIAGPGTGKTKVLVSRVAHLLVEDKIPPQAIIVTTFTKRAANEMVERLRLHLGPNVDLSRLLIGTFHSICFRIIKQFGTRIGLGNYNIANENDSDKILKETLQHLTTEEVSLVDTYLETQSARFKANDSNSKYHGVDVKKIKRAISSLKSNLITSERYEERGKLETGKPQKLPNGQNSHNVFDPLLSLIYTKYQQRLQRNELLDFDDCLLSCLHLVRNHRLLGFVQHVLVDEFQDTNEIQLQLMYEFARGHSTHSHLQHNVTIVGDPDQSIYSFRDAQLANFAKMLLHYELAGIPVAKVTLDENYRSTTDVLRFLESIMLQQQHRMGKLLRSQLAATFPPVYCRLSDSGAEARWIAYQISQLLLLPGMAYGDVAVLVRSSFQTRVIEDAFRRAGVPYLMVKGTAFWQRKEVTAIVDYLRVVLNSNDRVALLRILNYPKRGVGEKAMEAIEGMFESDGEIGSPALATLERIITSPSVKLSSKSRTALKKLITAIKEVSSTISDDMDRERFFDSVYDLSNLREEYKDDPNADLNVQEVRQQLGEYSPPDDAITEEETRQDNLIARFIQSVGLYETSTEEASDHGKVAISTIHGSKGLEWPVVFVPGLTENVLPARFALTSQDEESVDEERRCFYVSTTRAKVLLYVSSYEYYPGAIGKCDESRFLAKCTGGTSALQSAFENEASARSLYELMGKKWVEWDNGFYERYMKGLDEFGIVEKFDVPLTVKTPLFAPKYVVEKLRNQSQGFKQDEKLAPSDVKLSWRPVGLSKRRQFQAPRFVNGEGLGTTTLVSSAKELLSDSRTESKSQSGLDSRSRSLDLRQESLNSSKSRLSKPAALKTTRSFAPPRPLVAKTVLALKNRAPPYIPDRRR